MTLAERGEARAEATRLRALPQGYLRREEGGCVDLYEWPERTLPQMVKAVRRTKVPFGDGRWV